MSHRVCELKEAIMFGLGLPELMIILVIALVFFGPAKLPSMGKSLGEAIRGFKKEISDDQAGKSEKIEGK
jgi:sec-independent protein translocase protein TatA